MKLLILCSLILISSGIFAQIPEGYYNGTEGLYKEELKTKLHEIIKGHKEYFYSSSQTDTWDILEESDRDPNNSNNVILVYGGYSVSGPAQFPTWNREHVWAKSKGDFGTSIGPGTDCHNLKPSDESLNADRSNKSFDDGGWEVTDYTTPSGYPSVYKTGNKTDDNSWEPRDEVKGDIARIIFYMTVRYEGGNGEPDLEMVDYTTSVYSKEPLLGKKSTLLRWHQEDPPDDFERNRNNVIYSYQNNRNPFIDHPEFVGYIWGENTKVSYNKLVNKVYYAKNYIFCEIQTFGAQTIQIYSVEGRLLFQKRVKSSGLTSIPCQEFPSLVIVKVGSDIFKVFTGD